MSGIKITHRAYVVGKYFIRHWCNATLHKAFCEITLICFITIYECNSTKCLLVPLPEMKVCICLAFFFLKIRWLRDSYSYRKLTDIFWPIFFLKVIICINHFRYPNLTDSVHKYKISLIHWQNDQVLFIQWTNTI